MSIKRHSPNTRNTRADLTSVPGEKLSARIKSALRFIDTDPTAQARIEAALAEARDASKSEDLDPDVIAELLERGIIMNPHKFGLTHFVQNLRAQDWNDTGSHQEA